MNKISIFYPIKELRGICFLFCLLLLVAVGFVSTVNAYQLSGVKWPQPSTTFYVDIPGGDGLWNDAFEGAMYEWSAATVFQFYIASGTYSDPCDSSDARNGVRFASTDCGDEWGSTTLAVCHWWYTASTSTITEADIVFNSNESWNVYYTSWQSEVNDFRRVAVHELGHAIGLDHEDRWSSIMGTYAGDTTIPLQDDINGVAELYGLAVPASPTLNSPAANANVTGASVNLSWNASSGATQYWLWVRRTSDNVVIFNQNVGNRTSYALTSLPNDGKDYFWMVRAGNSSGWSKWTAARRFFNGTAAIPSPPTLNSPAANAKVAGSSVNLSWSASSGAAQYWLWVRRTSDNVVIFSQNVGNKTSYTLTGLPNNGSDYFWMVRAGNTGGWSQWAAARRFFNGTAAIPSPPTLNSPAANAKVAGSSVNLSWSASSGATQYWLWVRRTSDNVVIFSQNIGNKTSYTLTGLPNNGSDYFWMVRAGNTGGWSQWAAARRFFSGTTIAAFMDTFDDSFFTKNNWSKMTAVQQVWNFPTLSGSDLGYHVSTTSKELPGAMIANNNTSYHSAGLYVETLVRIDSHSNAYSSENTVGLGFVTSLYNGYTAGIQLDFDGSTEIALSIDVISGNTLGHQNVSIKFNTFYKLIFQIDSNDNMRTSLYKLDGTLLGSVFARNVLSIDSGIVGIWGKPEATFNNFKLTGNPVD